MDCEIYAFSGRFERRRLPKPLLFKRIAATAKIIVRRLRPTTEGQDRAIRVAAAYKLREELGSLLPPQEGNGGPPQTDEASNDTEPFIG